MRHLRTNPIQTLRNILRDQYEAGAIWSELLQNAEDAEGASELHIGWMGGWPQGLHPLLSSPAIFVLNDGAFSRKDAEAIVNLDVGGKADDQRAIGKFGLGMKSIFHWCEAFFYVSSVNQSAITEGSDDVVLVNPWPSDDLHPDWEESEQVKGCLRQRIGELWDHGCRRWFCLVLPLRTRTQLEGEKPIRAEYPRTQDVFGGIEAHLVRHLPLLRSLKRIELWRWSTAEQCMAEKLKISPRWENRCNFPHLRRDTIDSISGQTRTRQGRGRTEKAAQFAGREVILGNAFFNRIKKRDEWPQSAYVDEHGDTHATPEKAEPHCAAVFHQVNKKKDSPGKLTISHACYLPLRNRIAEVEGRMMGDYHLLLHGQFFLDAGRKGIHLSSPDDRGLEDEWNERMLRDGTLPLVLPALHDFVSHAHLDWQEVEGLTAAVQKSGWFQDNRAEICAEHQWIPLASREGSGGVTWELACSNQPVLEMPRPSEGDPALPFRVFRKLESICDEQPVTYAELPRLAPNRTAAWSRFQQVADKLFGSLNPDVVRRADQLNYLTSFIERQGADLLPGIRHTLIRRLRLAVRHHGLGPARERRRDFKRILGQIGEEALLPLSVPASVSDEEFCQLLDVDVDQLLLPEDLCPRVYGQHKLSIEDSRSLLSRLEEMDGLDNSARSALALQIIKSTAGTLEEKRNRCGNYQLFLIRGYFDDEEEVCSWNELKKQKSDRTLYAGRSPLARTVQNALSDIALRRLVTVHDWQPYEILFEEDDPPRCGVTESLDLLLRRPELRSPAHRAPLLTKLLGCPEDYDEDDYHRAVRYLLHGSWEHFWHTGQRLLSFGDDAGVDSARAWMARCALGKLKGEWRWVHRELWAHLTPDQARNLGIGTISWSEIEDLLKEAGVDWIPELDLSEEDRAEILKGIEDRQIWRKLPLHQAVSGERVAILGGRTFLELPSQFQVSNRLLNQIRLLKRPAAPALEAKYHRFDVPGWTPERAIEVAMAEQSPEEFAPDILQSLGQMECEDRRTSEDLLQRLKATPWLPSEVGPVAPQAVIDIPRMDEALTRLIIDDASESGLVGIALLDERVREHEAFTWNLRQRLFPGQSRSLRMLGQIVADLEAYQLGDIGSNLETPEQLERFVRVIRGISDHLLPGHRLLLDTVGALQSRGNCFQLVKDNLLPALLGDLSAEKTRQCLQWLSDFHKECSPSLETRVLRVHKWYLQTLPASSLAGLQLLNRNEEWVPVEELCADAEGIADEHLLCTEQKSALKNGPDAGSAPVSCSEKSEDSSGIKNLREYFSSWDGRGLDRHVGGFLAMLGDDSDRLSTAQQRLDPRSVRGIRDLLLWKRLKGPEGFSMQGMEEDIHTAMARQQFEFSFQQEGHATIPNLVGGRFQAKVREDCDSLFIGTITRADTKESRLSRVTLRVLNPLRHTQKELQELLLESTRVILQRVYCQQPDNLQEVWDDLTQCGQLELEKAQHLIVENAIFYFRQLGLGRLQSLKSLVRRWDRLRRAETERRHDQSGSDSAINKYHNEREELLRELQESFRCDGQVQAETLEAVRDKMIDYQYSPSSVPFELFQNSDDAARELADMLGDDCPDVRRVRVEWDESRLLWGHWGRGINEYRRGRYSAREGREKGYDGDLENMLILSSSDKFERESEVTGKFGLGFKSVFFLTDHPKIVSGQLGFEVIGGIFPKRLDPPDRQGLENWLETAHAENKTGTAIELPARSCQRGRIDEHLARFRRLAPVLLVFSREIKHCVLCPPGGDEELLRWEETPVCGLENASLGTLPWQRGKQRQEESTPARGLVLRTKVGDHDAAVLLGVGQRGIEPFSQGVPTFWTTNPTDGGSKLGFAVNGPWGLDVGRAQLALNSEENRRIARRIGEGIGTALRALFDAERANPGRFRDDLDLVGRPDDYGFWESVWQVLGRNVRQQTDEGDLARQLLWAEGCGMAGLISSRSAVPTGLPGRYRSLVKWRDVKWKLAGALDQGDVIFRDVTQWPEFRSRFEPGTVVSGADVANVVMELAQGEGGGPSQLTLKKAIQEQIGAGDHVGPAQARLLGGTITREFLDELDADMKSRAEATQLRRFLADRRFRARDGSWRLPADLLAPGERDEELRIKFAPDRRVLATDYTGKAIDFFRACRREMEAGSEILAEWGMAARTDEERGAFLRYLLEGDLGRGVAYTIKRRLGKTWLAELRGTEYFDQLDDSDQVRLLGLLGFKIHELTAEPGSAPVFFVGPTEVMSKISQWWQENRTEQIQRYEDRVYPGGKFPDIGDEPPYGDEQKCVEWLKFFLVALLHSVGRTTHEQNREFASRCERQGLLHELTEAESDPGALTGLVRVLNEYIDEQLDHVEYMHWIRRLVDLYLIARHVGEYTEAILAVDRIDEPFALSEITCPRTNPRFSGGGPDAPPIRQLLGLGAHFIVRELCRKGIVTNEHAHPHCFVPHKRVRDLIAQRLGGDIPENGNREDQARAIMKFVEEHVDGQDPTFKGAFDIPLQIVQRDDDLWKKMARSDQ